MAFKLARHFVGRSISLDRQARLGSGQSGLSPLSTNRGAVDAAATASLFTSALQLVSLPGLSGPLATAPTGNAPDSMDQQQLKTLQDTYSLMSGQGINVNVQNLDLQSRFE